MNKRRSMKRYLPSYFGWIKMVGHQFSGHQRSLMMFPYILVPEAREKPVPTNYIESFLKLIWSYDLNFRFVFCYYKTITVASSVQKKLNKSCLSIHNILCDLILTFVQVPSTLINIKPKLCFIEMVNMSYCGKSHWNGVKLSLLTKF